MIDPVSVGLAVGLLGTGWLFGRHARLRRTPGQPEPVCLCKHHYGAHDPETGACRHREKEWFQRSPDTDTVNVWVDCACVRYTGPQPVEQYWVPPAADMSIVVAPRQVERQDGA